MNWLIGVVIGAVSGSVAALCGVGGGIILVPAFVYFCGMEQRAAVATSLAVIIPTALMATLRNHTNNFVNWSVFFSTAMGAAVVAFFMADLLRVLSNQILTRIFALLLIAVGVHMLLRK